MRKDTIKKQKSKKHTGEPETEIKSEKRMVLPQVAKPVLVVTSLLIIIILALILVIIDLSSNSKSQLNADSSSSLEKQQAAEVVLEKFSEIYEIGNERPSVASVVDVELLKKEQPKFYKSAKNGDSLIILPESGMAFLFRGDTGKIINVSPVKFEEQK